MIGQTETQTGQDDALVLQLVEFALMIGIDMLFVAVLVLVMLPLGMYRSAAFAVMKRNFVGYFSNPTGYVFLCLFVLLTAFAAFWPHEFFTANLANFDQLNKFLPYIMLVFIPAITMSIWAEERRQGTDELLLTFPARDFDIVIGKYFAAVLVFTVSLLFSQLSNYAVLIAMTGGQLDTGLLFSTYLGYWFIGIAMLAIGMVASFLTNNLTIGFIFGAAFNAPLAFFSNADVIVSNSKAVSVLYDWSLLQRFEPFGRGLIAIASVIYFMGIVMLGVYLSLVLIGRRHWMGGKDGSNLLGHYVIRTALFVVIAITSVLVAQYSPLNRLRLDVSAEQVSTLASETRDQLTDASNPALEDQITIDCFISDNIPTDYVQTKYNLINRLREFDALGGSKIKVNLVTGISPVGKEASRAQKRFGIRPVPVQVMARGSQRTENVILGAAFTSGLDRIVIPFFDYGNAVEYELLRSINTLKQDRRKTIGVVSTDVMPFGERLRAGNRTITIPRMLFIDEIKKQYNVEMVDATSPIEMWMDDGESVSSTDRKRRYDVLLVIQPSKMSQAELDNLVAAVQTGQPTAIFEDPDPFLYKFIPNQNSTPQPYIFGTAMGRFLGRRGSNPRDVADIDRLYNVLEISTQGSVIPVKRTANGEPEDQFVPASVVSDVPNDYRSDIFERDEYVLVKDTISVDRFSPEDEITQSINEVMFMKPASINAQPNSTLEIVNLVNSAAESWLWVPTRQIDKSPNRQKERMLAARISGKNKAGSEINVVYVSDIDFIHNNFVNTRNRPSQSGEKLQMENIQFGMNIIDSLAGETFYFDIRNRKIRHSTLARIGALTKDAWDDFDEQASELDKDFAKTRRQLIDEVELTTSAIKNEIRKMEEDQKQNKTIDTGVLRQKKNLVEQIQRENATRIQNQLQALQEEILETRREFYLESETRIQDAQNQYKLAAVTYPAIPPLLVGLIVFVRRRLKERSGISKARRLK